MAQSFRILLVEDDDSLRACLGDFLAMQGWSVGATAFATEALAMTRQQRFDFSLLDFHLPETTGPELLQQLAAVRPLPAILMSGLASAAEADAAREAGFFAFLRKPLDLGRLRHSLDLLIASHFGGPIIRQQPGMRRQPGIEQQPGRRPPAGSRPLPNTAARPSEPHRHPPGQPPTDR